MGPAEAPGAAKGPMTSTAPRTASIPAGEAPARWGAVIAMTLAAFALIASEFMPVSLLTPIADDLGVTEGMAGQGIAVSGAFAVLTSLFIGTLAGRMDRKVVLIAFAGIMAASGALVALAPNYLVYMIGRVLIGVVVGGFWSLSAATAMRLVPERLVPRALAILNGGNALAAVLAAPLGSWLGAVVGWRGAFLALVPIALAALAWMLTTLPPLAAPERGASPRQVLGLLRRPPVAIGLAACGAFFMGQFLAFTYVRPFLETVPRVGAATVSLVLLAVGAAGLLGTALIGRFLERSLFRTLAVLPVLMASVALALLPLGPSVAAVFVLLGVWGLLATAAPVGWWTWLARSLPREAEAGGGLMVAVIQLSIALGSTVGGVLYDAARHGGSFGASAGVLLLGALLAVLASRSASRD